MDKHTWGNSQAAVNLTTEILLKPEYQQYSKVVSRKLTKQLVALRAIAAISNKQVRETTLLMWHDRFRGLVSSLPDTVRTHVLNVETGEYRQLLKELYEHTNTQRD